MRLFYKNSLKTKTRFKFSIAQQNIFTNIFSSFLTRDVAIKYRVTSIEESFKRFVYHPSSLLESAFRSTTMGVVVRGYTAQKSNVKRLSTATLHRCSVLDAMNFWRSENEVYGLVVFVVQAREEAQRNALTPPPKGTARGACDSTCSGRGVTRRRYTAQLVYLWHIRASSDIYLHRGSSAECTSRPNNCFWKCEQRALINASVALERNVSYDLLRRGGGKVCRVAMFCFYFGRPAAPMFLFSFRSSIHISMPR